jgi:hypothetical protein
MSMKIRLIKFKHIYKMIKHSIFLILLVLSTMKSYSQDKLPYYEVPDYPTSYTSGSVAARVIDGLGFRFYWATDSLRAEDLVYKPGDDARTSIETIDHIFGMSQMVLNATKNIVNSKVDYTLSFEVKRAIILRNLKEASDYLKTHDNLDEMKILYDGKNGRVEYPFWNHLNGPISDCIWHVGQIVSFRRASGNPINPNVSFFSGKVKE